MAPHHSRVLSGSYVCLLYGFYLGILFLNVMKHAANIHNYFQSTSERQQKVCEDVESDDLPDFMSQRHTR